MPITALAISTKPPEAPDSEKCWKADSARVVLSIRCVIEVGHGLSLKHRSASGLDQAIGWLFSESKAEAADLVFLKCPPSRKSYTDRIGHAAPLKFCPDPPASESSLYSRFLQPLARKLRTSSANLAGVSCGIQCDASSTRTRRAFGISRESLSPSWIVCHGSCTPHRQRVGNRISPCLSTSIVV